MKYAKKSMGHFIAAAVILAFSTAMGADDHYARGLVIQALKLPNKLQVGGREFRTKPNPKGTGVFVYDPRTRFSGVKRYLMWLTVGDQGYALNGPSKSLTPKLPWPREADPSVWEKTGLGGGPDVGKGLYTDQEGRMYDEMIAIPMSVSEQEALKRLGRKYGKSPKEVKSILRRVQDQKFSGQKSQKFENVTSYAIKLLFESRRK